MRVLAIVAYGRPGPQGSKRYLGKGVMIEMSKHVKPWREAVKWAAYEAQNSARLEPFDGPLTVRMVFTLRKPTSAPKTRTTYPDRTPDLSKLCRATEDALKDAGAIVDDARIVQYERLAKVFPNEDPEALEAPGVRIEIRTYQTKDER